MQEKDTKKAYDRSCTTCRHEDREYDESPCVDCVRGDGDDEMWEEATEEQMKKDVERILKGARKMTEEGKLCIKCRWIMRDPNELPCDVCYRGMGYNDMWESAEEQPQIKDSGERREFESGAVRDICEGKGRCDLLPLDVIGSMMNDSVITEIANFVFTRQTFYLFKAIETASGKMWKSEPDMVLDLARHFEEGAKKYGERNWEKGLPVHCYIDSAVRHYLKWCRGDKDEPHDRAFVWNLVCCIWTMRHRSDLDDLPKKEGLNEPVSG